MTSVYEFRFGRNPFRLGLAALIPEAGDGGWTTQMRWGFGRISGPYGHSILAGVIMLIGFLLNRWLIASGSWERDFKRLPGTPLKKSLIIELGLIAGVLMTMSRGPWISGIFAISTAAIGTARNARRAMVLGGIFVSLAGIATYTYTAAYTSGGRAGAQTQDQENAAYRAELLTIYEPLVMQRPVFGWGRTASDQAAWPVIDGMVSIDNYYLLVALTHGLGGLAFFALGLIVLLVRLLRAGLERGVNLQDRSLRFALAGVLVAIIVSLGTVYLGTQLYPIVFLMMGWAEGAVIFRSSGGAAETVSQERRGYRFERVYA
jgi:hypothetical protein